MSNIQVNKLQNTEQQYPYLFSFNLCNFKKEI